MARSTQHRARSIVPMSTSLQVAWTYRTGDDRKYSFNPLVISVNGKPAAVGEPGSYVSVDRTWTTGDAVRFTPPIG